ncbi:MAG: hypothetical protein K2Q45_02340 [Nitrosomonas sp.]|nr:hypothetical protein [Nitrosomonas sp.]
MGLSISSPQPVEVTPNGKWLHLKEADAYVQISSICFFQVVQERYMVFKLIDNSSSSESNGGAVEKITTTDMSRKQIDDIVAALTKIIN